jgi:hypothetical protein
LFINFQNRLRAKLKIFFFFSVIESVQNQISSVLGSQLFSGFWIGWMIGFATSFQQNPKIQLFWIFDIERVLNIQLFRGSGWMFNHPSNQKSRKS